MTDLRTALQTALGTTYTLERELGRGGMATVFLAQDLKHKRPVALKVLHPDLARTLGPERFQREIEVAARLQHPHILTVHDSGEAAGQLWFTMPYVEGESLRDRLRREKQLPVDEALRITREAAQALDYAHRHGVLHRDVKPENLLLTEDGNTLVADFGVARALQRGEDALTQTGLAVGTPAYMSPEQASGARDLDARTDVYALATVLYEMLAGEPPFAGPTPQAAMARRFTEAPRPLRQVRETVPEAVDHAVLKALAKAPADRFPSAAEFARALAVPAVTASGVTAPVGARAAQPAPRRRLPLVAITLGLGLLVGLGVLFAWRRSRGVVEAVPGPERLAVLPFENLGDSADAYFAEGVSDEVRGKLAGLPTLEVIARTSSSQYHGSDKPPAQVGRELGARYLLTGTVRWDKRAGGVGRVRVSPELIEARTGATRWQQPFEAPLTDLFQVQGDIAGRVAEALGVALEAGERQVLTERLTANLAAYDAFLRGEEASDRMGTGNPTRLRRAVAFYEQAVALDSTFALAWAQLSRAQSTLYANSTPSPTSAAAARLGAARAIALAPDRAEAHVALGDYYGTVLEDEARSLREYARGQRVEPRNAELLSASAAAELSLGRWDDALRHLQQGADLDPRSLNTARRLARTLLWLRRYPEALEVARRAVSLAPADPSRYQLQAMVHLAQGDLAGARAVLRAVPKEVEPTDLVAIVANYWDLYWMLDEDQQRLLLRLTPSAFDDDRGPWGLALAQTYALRGDSARARAYADSARLAYEEHLKVTPRAAHLHVLHGVALAYLGRTTEAVREGERGLALEPIAKNAHNGPYHQHQLVRIYIMAGEPDKAIDLLEPLLKVPYYLSPGWLRIDPTFTPLKGNPHFERLVEGRHDIGQVTAQLRARSQPPAPHRPPSLVAK